MRSIRRRSRLVGRPSARSSAGSGASRRCSAARSRACALSAFPRRAAAPPARAARAAHRAHQHLDGGVFLAHLDAVAGRDFARRFGRLAVDQDAALADLLRRQAARFVEARRPQPFVEPDLFHVNSGCSGERQDDKPSPVYPRPGGQGLDCACKLHLTIAGRLSMMWPPGRRFLNNSASGTRRGNRWREARQAIFPGKIHAIARAAIRRGRLPPVPRRCAGA